MRLTLTLLAVTALLILSSCDSKQQKTIDRISGMSDSLYNESTGMVNSTIAGQLLEECLQYAAAYPEDSLAPQFMLDAKNYALYVNDPIRSVKIMEDFLEKYPTHSAAPDVLFNLAYVYENYLGDLGLAKENYEQFIELYPDNGKLSFDARFALEHLGMPADQVLEEILARRDSVAVE